METTMGGKSEAGRWNMRNYWKNSTRSSNSSTVRMLERIKHARAHGHGHGAVCSVRPRFSETEVMNLNCFDSSDEARFYLFFFFLFFLAALVVVCFGVLFDEFDSRGASKWRRERVEVNLVIELR